ncbi:hypothetical protein EZS27_003899 [termite gut metagenome]|uniref:Uncharacterized protein n=1 Tax=termite gut metagenome TaxID=433724 RepID=A0A5J4SRD9_9ZZZZ
MKKLFSLIFILFVFFSCVTLNTQKGSIDILPGSDYSLSGNSEIFIYDEQTGRIVPTTISTIFETFTGDYLPEDVVRRTEDDRIALDNDRNLLGIDTQGEEFNLIELNRWDEVDVATEHKHLNLNSSDRPTIQVGTETGQEAESIAFVSDIIPYDLPVATPSVLGGVKPDGSTITVTEDGIISSTGGGSGYTLPPATTDILGGIKVGAGLSVTGDGLLSSSGEGGVVKSVTNANGLSLDGTGNLSMSALTKTDVGLGNVDNTADSNKSVASFAVPRTLWGQSFDGTSNITGAISATRNITPETTDLYSLGTSALKYKDAAISTVNSTTINATDVIVSNSITTKDITSTGNVTAINLTTTGTITANDITTTGTITASSIVTEGTTDTKDMQPGESGTYDIGTPENSYKGIYVDTVHTVKVSTDSVVTKIIQTESIVTNSAEINNVTIHGGSITGTFTGNITGNVTGNADTATKLATARTLWGQNFDGSANISGAISNTGNIIPETTDIYGLGTSTLKYKDANISTVNASSVVTDNITVSNNITANNITVTGGSGIISGVKAFEDITVDNNAAGSSTYEMGNENDGGYIVGVNSGGEAGGISMNGLVPQLYHKNLSAEQPYRLLFEAHTDGLYISKELSGTNWVKIPENADLQNILSEAKSYTDAAMEASLVLVDDLPETGDAGVIYLVEDLVKPDVYDKWAWKDSAWFFLGTTAIDLSGYETLLADVADKATITDADKFYIRDAANGNSSKAVSFSSTKGTLKSYFDGIYTLSNLGGVPTTRTINGYDLSANRSLTATDVGLGNVDNTADANKDVNSAATLTTARSIALSGGATGTATDFNGSSNITIPVTALDATKLSGTASINTTGKATTSGTADKVANALTFTGGVTGTYDGSSAVSVAIPDIATTSVAGIVKPDNNTITITEDGTISRLGGSGITEGSELFNILLASTWTSRTTPTTGGWYSVCWSKEAGLFVAVSSATSNSVMTSPDGITWTSRTTPTTGNWRSVCWSKETRLFVAVSYASSSSVAVMTSPDGITWTSCTTPTTGYLQSVCWSEEARLFVAVSSVASSSVAVMTTLTYK